MLPLTTGTVLELSPALSSVMSFPDPAAKVVVPTATFPPSVIAPVRRRYQGAAHRGRPRHGSLALRGVTLRVLRTP